MSKLVSTKKREYVSVVVSLYRQIFCPSCGVITQTVELSFKLNSDLRKWVRPDGPKSLRNFYASAGPEYAVIETLALDELECMQWIAFCR